VGLFLAPNSRHTNCVIDGSSDVCAYDLVGAVGAHHVEDVGIGGAGDELVVRRAGRVGPVARRIDGKGAVGPSRAGLGDEGGRAEIGRASCRDGGGVVGGGVGVG